MFVKKSVLELFDALSEEVFNYALSILKDYDDAKDAVQEVFIQHMRRENTFRGDSSYKTWLLAITRNYCYRKAANKSKMLKRVGTNPAAAYEMNMEASITLNDALEELTNEEYEIIYLREYAGYSYQEMAEILEISLDNVKIKIFRIRQKLRNYLK
mgnify:CR=1 FL=1